MKNFLLLTCVLIMSCSGCVKQDKGCTPVQPQAEVSQIQTFAADTLILTKDSSGIYYQVINPGMGETATISDSVYVTYTGKLLNGTIFDQSITSPAHFLLGAVIEGWQIGIPLIKKGGRIKLVIPSAYAYGCNQSQGIPPNSVLYFDISLLDVK